MLRQAPAAYVALSIPAGALRIAISDTLSETSPARSL